MKLVKPVGHCTWFLEVIVKDQNTDTTHVKLIDTHEHDRAVANRIVAESRVKDMDDVSNITRLTAEVAQVIMAGKAMTVEEVIEEWYAWMSTNGGSIRTTENNIGVVKKWATDMLLLARNIGTISQADVSGWINRPENTNKRGTRKMNLVCIRGLMKFASIKRYVLTDPSALVSIDHSLMTHEQKEVRRKKVFTDDEIDFLLAKCSDAEPPSITPGFFKAAIILGRDLALRLGDVCRLEWASFDFASRTVIVWMDKTNARVQIPMSKRVLQLVTGLDALDERYLFPNERELAIGPKRALLSVVFGRFFAKHGFMGQSFHDLRATYATTMANNGATVEEIAELLGHSKTSTTKTSYIRREGAAKVG